METGRGGRERPRATRKLCDEYVHYPDCGDFGDLYAKNALKCLYLLYLCNLLHFSYTSTKPLKKLLYFFPVPYCLSQGFCFCTKRNTTMFGFTQTIECSL
jgi:hypothetical protein